MVRKFENKYMKSKLQEQEQQTQETIYEELVQKFDGDKQLVEQFINEGYTKEELLSSTITHPTKFDPVCTLQNGQQAGIWLYKDNNNLTNTKINYKP